MHVNLAARIREVLARGRKQATTNRFGARSRRLDLNTAKSFIFDYNTVESVLLACAVLVNLAGIMFESKLLSQSQVRQATRS